MRYHDTAVVLVIEPQIIPEDTMYCPNSLPSVRIHIQIYLSNVIGTHNRYPVTA
jgi:hypothetical protein